MIEAHKVSHEQLPVDTPEPYEVRLVDQRIAEDPKYQRRRVLARCVPTATLMEYWRKQGARTGHQACVSSSAKKDLLTSLHLSHLVHTSNLIVSRSFFFHN